MLWKHNRFRKVGMVMGGGRDGVRRSHGGQEGWEGSSTEHRQDFNSFNAQHTLTKSHTLLAAGDEHRTEEISRLSGSFAAAERHTQNRTKK